MMYWTERSDSSNSTEKKDSWLSSQSADLEITSYVLLAKLYNFNLRKNDINPLIKIAKWINSQRNSLGGFYSTQVRGLILFSNLLKTFSLISF